ncbi:hypothetical protein DAMNIGENAA_39090 [Desulforhabdus amnigena]|uniref:Uncharacterized protein n=1 Tax=Desulforhabdus amnigena TaxID=40218 RepID=A0A9W6FX30_9BACT|nr:hypothetical protein DAMNIGENAA_39090 [Desulforhabdus amnigena]
MRSERQAFYSALEEGNVEVYEEPYSDAREFEVCEELGFVNGLEAVAGFEFQEKISHHGGTEGTELGSFFTGREAAGKKACLQVF